MHFFPSPFNELSWSTSGDAISGLSCGGIALQYTDEWSMELPHESPEEPDVRCHEQGIDRAPSLRDERRSSIVSSSRSD